MLKREPCSYGIPGVSAIRGTPNALAPLPRQYMPRPEGICSHQLISAARVLDLIDDHGQQLSFNPVFEVRKC
ncbi:hypothetical protein D3C86_2110690 [compost metagenome]